MSLDQLTELLGICKKVKKSCKLIDGSVTNGYTLENGIKMPIVEEGKEMTNQELAHKLLPTASGFFFGNTDYDQYYMDDIDNTIEIIESLLSEKEPDRDYLNADIYYSSSW